MPPFKLKFAVAEKHTEAQCCGEAPFGWQAAAAGGGRCTQAVAAAVADLDLDVSNVVDYNDIVHLKVENPTCVG